MSCDCEWEIEQRLEDNYILYYCEKCERHICFHLFPEKGHAKAVCEVLHEGVEVTA